VQIIADRHAHARLFVSVFAERRAGFQSNIREFSFSVIAVKNPAVESLAHKYPAAPCC